MLATNSIVMLQPAFPGDVGRCCVAIELETHYFLLIKNRITEILLFPFSSLLASWGAKGAKDSKPPFPNSPSSTSYRCCGACLASSYLSALVDARTRAH